MRSISSALSVDGGCAGGQVERTMKTAADIRMSSPKNLPPRALISQ
jgi:hypothetical protein